MGKSKCADGLHEPFETTRPAATSPTRTANGRHSGQDMLEPQRKISSCDFNPAGRRLNFKRRRRGCQPGHLGRTIEALDAHQIHP